MPERIELKRELERIHKDLIKMGATIEQSMEDMIEAFLTQNAELARDIIERDDEIDDLELQVEQDCIRLIARQQPMARDLRDTAAILKIITDLERIGDHCSDISQYIINLSEEKYIKSIDDIPLMMSKVKLMVRDAIDICIRRDLELAKDICNRDQEINDLFYHIIDEIVTLMNEFPGNARQLKEFMFIVKYLERMGDHATNVAEWIIYSVTGTHDYK
ncbi:MAG: phosphate signaling complex protein PhoU [Vallitaleaceae bacterium]|jgi:phosphate transport system protein|nr:phosphate signaling complex protein PhoU [Vallitaleaceae bacterium]